MGRSRRLWLDTGKVIVILVTLVVVATAAAATTVLRKGKVAPVLSWLGTDGAQYTWQSLQKDRPAVVVFWGTWCAVCKKDWPSLIEIEREFADSPTAPVWIAVAVLDSAEKAARAATERHLPGFQLCDPKEQNFAALELEFVPTVCVLDSAGKVVFVGDVSPRKLREILAGLAR